MPSCPYCLEETKAGARKCPHCQTSLEPGDGRADGSTVYVVDRGLVTFAKFSSAVLAIFVVVGLYLFGFDIKQASDQASEAKLQAQQAVLEIQRQKAALDGTLEDIRQGVLRIEALEREIAGHRATAQESAALVGNLVADLRRHQDEANQIVSQLRILGVRETVVATAERESRGIESDRRKLWQVGSTVRFGFLDGGEPEKQVVRAAIGQWASLVNLTLTETSPSEAEVRISFEQPGSWSYVGTDALGIAPDQPTLNYGTLAQLADEDARMQSALHEFGHALGLVHEFQNPSAGEIFDREATLAYYSGFPNLWPDSQIEAALLQKSPDYPGSRGYDPESIMSYSLPGQLFLPGRETRPGARLSASDKAYVASLYPAR